MKLLIKHDWYVTYQEKPIEMAGFFASVEAFNARREQWQDSRLVHRVEMVESVEVEGD